ncbi:MAG: 3-phosphoshikimate 1-carboxyvinyltransferase [Nitrospirota bacterium]|nr:3-phosphoshikimate 1-carboxyvinyltransferase [Nitrospirota bacterium]
MTTKADRITVRTSKGLRGEITVPGDKSISHRSVMFGAISRGETRITGFLNGEDSLGTAKAFRLMGIGIDEVSPTELIVHGKGIDGLSEPTDVLDLGNSGTSMRLLTGLLAGQSFFSVLTGDQYLRKRPMGRVTDPLKTMGARIDGRDGGKLAPLAIHGSNLKGVHYVSPIASAQVKSAVLLAGLYAEGETSVSEPEKSRDHTERMLAGFGATVRIDGLKATVVGRPDLIGRPVAVPGDISSAAFFLVAASIVPGSELLIKNVGVNPTRTGIIDALRNMGADITLENMRDEAGEPVADLLVRSALLKGITLGGEIIPRMIDEVPVLAVAAALAEGETVIRDAKELRVKETDRIATMAAELRKVGVEVEELSDGMRIVGGKPISGAVCESHGDHRVAMSMLIAGLAAKGETTVNGTRWIETSFPGFEETLKRICS